MEVKYKLDGVDLKDYGVFVSNSEGLLSLPKPKQPLTVQWPDYNGEVVDLTKRTYEARDIQLDCFIKASSQWEFQDKCNDFLKVLDSQKLKQLNVCIDNLSGNENLLLNSKDFVGNDIRTMTLTSGVTYTFSIEGSSSGYFYIHLYPNSGDWGSDILSEINLATGGLIKRTFIAPSTGIFKLRATEVSGSYTIVRPPKIEVGNLVTDYSPAKSDLKPLVFEVYLADGVDFKKSWSERNMVGTFSLKLREPEPVKKVLKFVNADEEHSTVSITVTSSKLLNIYWGDGTHTYDVSGTAQTITHSYGANVGTFFIVITGNIDQITSLTTTGVIVWNKL